MLLLVWPHFILCPSLWLVTIRRSHSIETNHKKKLSPITKMSILWVVYQATGIRLNSGQIKASQRDQWCWDLISQPPSRQVKNKLQEPETSSCLRELCVRKVQMIFCSFFGSFRIISPQMVMFFRVLSVMLVLISSCLIS